jgi:phosphohistidine swiveling domain-containing protein
MIEAIEFIEQVGVYGGIFLLAPAVVFMALAAFTAALTLALGMVVLVNRALVVAAFFAVSALALWIGWLVVLRIKAWRFRHLAQLSFLVQGIFTPHQVGEKAYRLGRATEHFDNIPPGWVLTAKAYRSFIRANRLKMAQRDPTQLTPEQRRELAHAIVEGKMPRSLERRIGRCVSKLGPGALVVRSSFLGEDARGRSYSGIFRSIFVEASETEIVIEAIKQVWASFYDERVVDYIGASDNGGRAQVAGVILQLRVEHEVACIAATVDFIDGRPECIIADISDSAGQTLPPARIDRITGAISYPGEERAELARALLKWLSANADNLEAPVNGPAQIECGAVGDKIYLYQIRPLSVELGRRVLVNSYLVELPPYPLTPLSESIIAKKEKLEKVLERPLWNIGFSEGKHVIVRRVAGRFYADWRQLRLMQRELLAPHVALGFSLRLGYAALSLLPELFDGGAIAKKLNNHDCKTMTAEEAYARLLNLAKTALPGPMDVDSRCATLAGLAEEWAQVLYGTRDRSIWPVPTRALGSGRHGYFSERAAEVSLVEQTVSGALKPAAATGKKAGKASGPEGSLLDRLRGKDGRGLLPWRKMLVKLLIAYRNRCLIARENSKQQIMAVNYRIKCLIERIAEEKVMGKDLIYYLNLKELGRLAIAHSEKVEELTARARVARRKFRAHEATDVGPVVYIDSDGRLLPSTVVDAEEGEGLILVGYSGGDLEGVVKFVDSDEIDSNSILFLPDAESRWVSYLDRVQALVAGSGGPLSHLAIVAREQAVPFAVAGESAKNHFKDGDRVAIDSRSNRVRRVF